MNIIFFGSDDFAARHLSALINSQHKVLACVTQPDKPKGRGMPVGISPIKTIARQKKIALHQPTDIKGEGILKQFKSCGADFFVVIAYGRILPKKLLQIPKEFVVNVHASLLPRYRGAAPINWAVMSGETRSGITIMKVDERLDAGDMIKKLTIAIEDADTAQSLREKMMEAGPDFLIQTLNDIEKGQFHLEKQDESQASYAPKLTKDLGKIDWRWKALRIHNLVRGLVPWPGAYTNYKDKILKVLSTEVVVLSSKKSQPGAVMSVDKKGFVVAAGDQKGLLVRDVHLQASRPMGAYEFVIGHQLTVGFKFP